MIDDKEKIIAKLFNPSNFCAISELQTKKGQELGSVGYYCIKFKDDAKLPPAYQLHFKSNRIVYIGVAESSLYKRLWEQELNAIWHGTFFRSVGAMLGYRPEKGSLVGKSNKRNYKFSKEKEELIKQWMQNNLIVNCVNDNDSLKEMEKMLIKQYRPLLNIINNPDALECLKQDRKKCIDIANSQ